MSEHRRAEGRRLRMLGRTPAPDTPEPFEEAAEDRIVAARMRPRLAEIDGSRAGSPARPLPVAQPWRTRRFRGGMPWQAGLVGLGGVVAAGAAAAITMALLPGGAPGRGAPVTAGQVLELAAHTARGTAAVPAGARWRVWESRTESSAWSPPVCGMSAAVTGAPGTLAAKVRGSAACQDQPPASLPQLRETKPSTVNPAAQWGPLPSQPGPLLAAIYRQLRAEPRDSVPGRPPGTVTAADLNEEAFNDLRVMIGSGLTSPSPAVQLAAMARIPGIEIVRGTHAVLGRPAIEITVTGSEDRESILLDPASYAVIGGKIVQANPSVTVTDVQLWQAYYDGDGHRL